MEEKTNKDISKFYIAGINYRKSDATTRGLFAINNDQYANLLSVAPVLGIDECFVLSTCNRTEIYGFAESPDYLGQLVCSQTTGTPSLFFEMAYVKKGEEAIEHLFTVAAGLDSQILGDYEIVGQIKQAVKFAKEHGFVGAYLERLVNAVLQSSKVIKNQTMLSGGTVSVSFAAVQYIREHFTSAADKKILLLGVGKIGRNTCRNLVDYLGVQNITLINRTEDKAAELASEMHLQYAPLNDLQMQIEQAEIILVATNAPQPVILRQHLEHTGKKLLIDLSIPSNVEETAGDLQHITLVNVDELSRIKDETLQKRESEVPKAKNIIAAHIAEFMDWHAMRKNVPVLKAVKSKLEQMNSCEMFTQYSLSVRDENDAVQNCQEKIQKVINVMAVKMRRQNQQGCQYIEAINDYIAIGANG